MVVYLARRIKMGMGHDRAAPKPGAAHLLPDAAIIYRFDPLIDGSILRMLRQLRALTADFRQNARLAKVEVGSRWRPSAIRQR